MNLERKITLFNLFNFTIIFFMYIKFYHIDGLNKREIICNFRHIWEQLIGKELNDKYGIYIITLYHYPAIITTIIALIISKELKNFLINFLYISFIGYTNLLFKGCLVRKYEKELMNGDETIVTKLMNMVFDVYFKIFNIEPKLENKIVAVFYLFFFIYILLSIKLISLLSKT